MTLVVCKIIRLSLLNIKSNDVKIKISLANSEMGQPSTDYGNSNSRLFVPFWKDIKTMQREVIVAIDAGHGGRDPEQ